MRIVTKLTIGLVAGMSLILAANGMLRVRREVAILHADRANDQDLLGRSLGDAVASVWRTEGPDAARAVITATEQRSGRIHLRWVAEASALSEPLRALSHSARASHSPSTAILARDGGAERRWTLAPVEVAGRLVGFLELSESLDAEKRVVRATVEDTVLATVTLAVVSGLLAALLGAVIVGRPISGARRQGAEDRPRRLRGARARGGHG